MTHRNINDLPVGVISPITDDLEAHAFLEALCLAGLDFHPDDDPEDCLAREYGGGPNPPLSPLAAKFIGWQLRDAGHHVDDVHDALMAAHVRVHGYDSAFKEEDGHAKLD